MWLLFSNVLCFLLKVQIEKTLINKRFRVSKVSNKFRIPAIHKFAVTYLWNLLEHFSKKLENFSGLLFVLKRSYICYYITTIYSTIIFNNYILYNTFNLLAYVEYWLLCTFLVTSFKKGTFNPIQVGPFRGCSRMGGAKRPPT